MRTSKQPRLVLGIRGTRRDFVPSLEVAKRMASRGYESLILGHEPFENESLGAGIAFTPVAPEQANNLTTMATDSIPASTPFRVRDALMGLARKSTKAQRIGPPSSAPTPSLDRRFSAMLSRQESMVEAPSGAHRRSLRQAIHLGAQVYASLPVEARQDLHARKRKGQSLRRLAEARRVPVSTLWRSIAIYLLSCRHPEIVRFAHVGVYHVSMVLGVAHQEQIALLREAEQRRWSSQKLARAIKARIRGREATIGQTGTLG